MTRARIDVPHEVVDLSSDSDDDVYSGDGLEFFEMPDEMQGADEDLANVQGILNELNARYSPALGAADGPIDLTAIPDIDVPPSIPGAFEPEVRAPDDVEDDARLVPEAVCLQMVRDVLPDISVDHVLKFIQEQTTDQTRTTALCENIILQLLDGEAYPKEADEAKNKKRKRDDEDDWEDYDKSENPSYESDAEQLLKDEFVNVPVRHINAVLKEHKTLFKAYAIIDAQVRNHRRIANSFRGLQSARNKRGIELILIEKGSKLPKELHAARKKAEGEMVKRHKAEEAEQAEKDNLKRAQENNEMGECACCFDDIPLNRMIACTGNTSHFFCPECPRRQIETQMGQSKCRPKCFAVDECEGTFSRAQLQLVLSERTFERLEHMQQQQDLAAAGLDFLSECPFCDFKMECLPVEVDKEFRCQSTKCGKTSCRLCNKVTHIPLTCEEAAKDGQITLRHIVEEAMSAALIRQCNRCKHPFVKEYGCNKMTCSHCRNVQCYVCSKNVADYNHFGDSGHDRCPLHENVEDRHEQEVKKAADEAMAKVRADNPGLSDADLMIKVSDRVKEAEDARKVRAQGQADAFPYHMVNDNIIRRPAPRPEPQYVPAHPYAFAPLPMYVQPIQPIQPIQPYVPPAYYNQPPPYRDNLGAAIQPPNHPPAAVRAIIGPPPNRIGRNGAAAPPRPQAQLPIPPGILPGPPPGLPRARPDQRHADEMIQRLEQLRQARDQRFQQYLQEQEAEQQQARQQHNDDIMQRVEANVQGRLRLLRLEQENLELHERAEQGLAALLEQGDHARRQRRGRMPR